MIYISTSLMNKLICISVFIVVASLMQAQKPVVVQGSIFDAETGEPISEVHVFIKGSEHGTITDSKGVYSIILNKLNDTIIYTHVRYADYQKIYSGSDLKSDILMEPMINMLPDAVVKPVVNISKGMLLDVTDYYFLGDSILYSGFCYRYNKKKNPWIVLLTPKGDTVFSYCVGMEGKFYKDCLGNLHYLTEDTAYQIFIEGDSIRLEYPMDIKEFKSIMDDCKFESDGKVLFSQYTDRNQILVYYYTDTTTYETEVFRTIADEVKLNMLAFQGLFFSMGPPPNEHDLRFEEMMYNPVFAPVILAHDTISIINYTDSKIEWFDNKYNFLGSTPIYFQNSKYCEDEIVTDPVSGRVYAVFMRNGKTSVKEIFINSGTTGQEISIPEFFWIDNIKVHDNKLYFLYREKYSGELRALYRMFLD